MPALGSRTRGETRASLVPELVLVIGAGWALYGILRAVGGAHLLFSFETWVARAANDPLYRVYWLLGNLNDAEFYFSIIGGVALLLAAWAAHRLDRSGSRWRGFPIVYGTGLWPSVLAASLLGLVISVAAYGFIISKEWIPTFVPFVSIPGGVVLIYGAGWRNVLTGGVLGGVITFPIAYLVIKVLLEPNGFPDVIGNVTGMWLGGILVFELCHRALPWMRRQEPLEEGEIPERAPEDYEQAERSGMERHGWLARRTLADFSEAQFYGNELASAGLLAGTILSWILDSRSVVYGSGLLPALLVSQIMASALGIVLYYPRWRELKWYPTFVPVVSVAPGVVLTYGGSVQSIVAGAVLGALIGPPIAQFIIDRLPEHWHLYVANTLSMAICTAVVVAILIPVPGFTLPS